jgi:hypothetical protein
LTGEAAPVHFQAAVFTAFLNRPFGKTNCKNHQSARYGVDTRKIVAFKDLTVAGKWV